MRGASFRSSFGLWITLASTVACHYPAQAARSQTTKGQTTEAQAQRPNILFLFADDQRPDSVAAFGNEHIRTPVLDRLASRGYRFAQNYCMGGRHGAVCICSRAMLMSGRSLPRVRDDMRDVHSLPQCLAESGYVTFATGKWHNGPKAFLRCFQQGRNIMLGGMSDHTKVPVVDLDPEKRTFSKVRTARRFSSRLFAETVIEFLDGRAAIDKEAGERKPFFAYVAFTAPHDPRNPPEDYRKPYYEDLPPLPANFRPQVEWFADETWSHVRDECLAAWPRDPDVIRQQLAEYYGLITHLDGQIGRIFEALDKNGYGKNTVVVYTADHGLALGSHGLVGKQSIYEHSMGCPLILAGPGIPAGKTSHALTYLLDLNPTLCKLAGAKVDASVEGRDLMPIVRGDSDKVRDSLFLMYRGTQRSVRDDRYKLIRFPEIDKTLLYDLQDDPSELRDLSDLPQHEERVEKLWKLLESWQAQVGDEAPLTVDQPRPQKRDLTGGKRKPDRWQPEWIRKKYFDDQ